MCSSVRCKACVFWFYNELLDRGCCEIAEVLRARRNPALSKDEVHEELLKRERRFGNVVKISELSQFIQAGVDVKTGDVLRFKDPGVIRPAEETPFGREVFQINVELPTGEEKTLTMNRTSQRNIAKEYGDETERWVGKEAVVTVVKQNVRGTMKDVVYLNPLQKSRKKKAGAGG